MLDLIGIIGQRRIELKDEADLAMLIVELARVGSPSFRLRIGDKSFRATYLHQQIRVED